MEAKEDVKMAYRTLREWLRDMEGQDRLRRVAKAVNLKYELTEVSKECQSRYALWFEKPVGEGYAGTMPVVSNSAVARDDYARALGVSVMELPKRLRWAQDHPVAPVMADAASAPVKEVVEPQVDLSSLPVPVHHEGDNGAFLTSGVLVAKNPVTGERNLSIHRMQIRGKDQLGILMVPRHLSALQKMAEDLDRPLEVAVCIGLDPIMMLASQAIAPLGFDEYGIAGALYGEGVPLVSCETVDLEVPAGAEIVLEGFIPPHVRKPEGPFGEYPQYYSPQEDSQIVCLTCLTRRQDAIYQTVIPAAEEHLLLGAIARESHMLDIIRMAVPSVGALQLERGGNRRTNLVIQMEKRNDGEVRAALLAAFACAPEVKYAVAVDPDVNLFDSLDVAWAIATRSQPDQDVMIIPGVRGSVMDPSGKGPIGSKMGIDATAPMGERTRRFCRIKNPYDGQIDLKNYF